ncbi:alpha/beta hydrolase [Leifsonia sp. F6_8S_P_1B]|uniref:Alpha/beta hydrolase n=1 Tax=Leifsonia williamsii TaxID=3035919 RepID=A0ABT8KDG9_9MICO|nr:alpha/beta hydrolase [Leifsonia williamsii]MDN4615518.1 alpha/beta hydrolase [Leifsonia williamsii]
MTAELGPVVQVEAGALSVGLVDLGPSDAPAVLLLHGWPYAIDAFAECAPMLVEAGFRVIVPHLRGYGSTRLLRSDAVRNGEPAALAADAIDLLDALGVQSAVVAGFDWGARTANVLAALHPERCRAQVAVSGYLLSSQESNATPLPPAAELAWWYQFYFATERGRRGYETFRDDFARLIWRTASPRWAFDDAAFARSAAALDNPDHAAIVIHNYRWRLGLAEGEQRFAEVERRLAQRPVIAVPTITMEGDANGAAHPEPAAYRDRFTGPYEHRELTGGIGHALPQEAPRAFADAVIDADRMAPTRMAPTGMAPGSARRGTSEGAAHAR